MHKGRRKSEVGCLIQEVLRSEFMFMGFGGTGNFEKSSIGNSNLDIQIDRFSHPLPPSKSHLSLSPIHSSGVLETPISNFPLVYFVSNFLVFLVLCLGFFVSLVMKIKWTLCKRSDKVFKVVLG